MPRERRRLLLHEWVTGGGPAGQAPPASWLREGRAMRAALARDFAAVREMDVVATLDSRLVEERGATWSTVSIGPGEAAARLRALAREADYTLVIAPETGGVLEESARLLATTSTRSLGSSAASIATAADKSKLAAILGAAGVPTPQTVLVNPRRSLPRLGDGPVVLKPIDGAGCLHTYYMTNTSYSVDPALLCDCMIMQPYVSGIPSSASWLVDASGHARLIAVGTQNIAIEAGRFEYRGGTIPAPRDRADAAVRAAVECVPGLRGFVGVDFVWDDTRRRATVIEINPRPTTTIVALTHRLGAGTLARAWLAACGDDFAADPALDACCERLDAGPEVAFRADGTFVISAGATVGGF